MATLALGAVGAGIGFSMGGPLGAYKGLMIGAAVGSYIDEMNNRPGSLPLSDLRYSGSSYGTSIPRGWGTFPVAGNIVWCATDSKGNNLVKHSGGGGSGGTPSQDWYSATFAVYLAAGTLTMPDGSQVCRNVKLKRLWADDQVVYDSANPKSTLQIGHNLTYYSGTETQGQDPTIVASMGTARTPAYRGMAYVVIQDLNLQKFGNRIPNFRAELATDSVVIGDIFGDLAKSTGLTGSLIDVSQATTAVTGFVEAERQGGDRSFLPLAQAYAVDVAESDGLLRVIPRGAAISTTVAATDLGATTGSETGNNPAYHVTRKLTTELASRFEVNFLDVAAQFQQGMQRDTRRTATAAITNVKSTKLPIALTNDQARAIAARGLDEDWLEASSFEFTVPYRYLSVMPTDLVGLPTQNGTVRLRVTKVVLAGPSEIQLTGVPDNQALYGAALAGNITAGISPLTGATVAGATTFFAWSGTEVRDADQGVAGFYVVASGTGAWPGASVYYSPDSGTSWVQAGQITTAGNFGVSTNALVTGTTAGAFDNTNTLSVDMTSSGGSIASTSDPLISTGQNLCLAGSELLSSGTASLTAPSVYNLTHILRGERSTSMSGHAIGEPFVLVDGAVLRVTVPSSLVGTVVQVKCIGPDETLAMVTAQNVTIATPTPTSTQAQLTTVANSILVDTWIAPVTLADSGASTVTFGAWTTLNLASYIPTGAKEVLLFIRLSNSSGSTTWKNLKTRKTSADAGRTVGTTQSGASGDTSSYGALIQTPCGVQTIDYYADAGQSVFIEIQGYKS